MKIIIRTFILLSSILLAIASYYYWKTNLPLLSPLDLITHLSAPSTPQESQKVVFGFLPYWNMKYSNTLHIKNLTHLAYFGVDLNKDGTLNQFDRPGEQEPGYRQLVSHQLEILIRQLHLTNKKAVLVIRAMNNNQITSIINSTAAQRTAIEEIVKLAKEKRFDGLNVDFEYIGSPDQETRNNFTQFVSELGNHCRQQIAQCEISLDIYADTAAKTRLYDLDRLANIVDLIVVMA